MKAFHFGPAASPRFGLFQPPAGPARAVGVLLCYPGVQEYNMTHWAFRKLAGLLNRSGFPVMRFDYACTGDSAGETRDGRAAVWQSDVALAAQELKDVAEVGAVSIVGMRLGGALAARAVAQGLAVRDLVLWEPVVSGRRYVAELEDLDARETKRLLHPPSRGQRDELAGFPFPAELRRELDAVALEPERPKAAQRISIFSSTPNPDLDALKRAWSSAGLPVTFDVVDDRASVTAGAARDTAALYTGLLAAISDRLAAAA